MSPLRGFGGDGPMAVADDERNPTMSPSKSTKRGKPARGKNRSNPPARPAKTNKAGAGATRAGTKQEAVLSLLKQPKGTTISAIMKATGWQQHSVRGFLAAVVRRKLGLALVSEKTDGDRLYRIAAARPPQAKPKPPAGDRPATQQGAATP
jgi:Protein of unknown function (DUF3489)